MSHRPSSLRSRIAKSMKGAFSMHHPKNTQTPAVSTSQKRATNFALQLLATVPRVSEYNAENSGQSKSLDEHLGPIADIADKVESTATTSRSGSWVSVYSNPDILNKRKAPTLHNPNLATQSDNTSTQLQPTNCILQRPIDETKTVRSPSFTGSARPNGLHNHPESLHRGQPTPYGTDVIQPTTLGDVDFQRPQIHNSEGNQGLPSSCNLAEPTQTVETVTSGYRCSKDLPLEVSPSEPNPHLLTTVPSSGSSQSQTQTQTRDCSVPAALDTLSASHGPNYHVPQPLGTSQPPLSSVSRDSLPILHPPGFSNQQPTKSCAKHSVTPSPSTTRPSPVGKTHLRLKLDAHTGGFIPFPTSLTPGPSATHRISTISGLPTSAYGFHHAQYPFFSDSGPQGLDGMGVALSKPSINASKHSESISTTSSQPSRTFPLFLDGGGPTSLVDVIDSGSYTVVSDGPNVGPSPSQSTIPTPRSPTTRSVRSTMPALRRDGSSFYTTIDSIPQHYSLEGARSANVTGETTPGEGLVESLSEDDGGSESNEDEDNDVASDDEEEVEIKKPKLPLPNMKDILNRVITMGSTNLSDAKSIEIPTTHHPIKLPPQHASASASAREDLDLSPPHSKRLSLVAMGAPSIGLNSFAESDLERESDPASLDPSASLFDPSNGPSVRAIPRLSQPLLSTTDPEVGRERESIYLTPMHTPLPSTTEAVFGQRDTVYFDFEERSTPDLTTPTTDHISYAVNPEILGIPVMCDSSAPTPQAEKVEMNGDTPSPITSHQYLPSASGLGLEIKTGLGLQEVNPSKPLSKLCDGHVPIGGPHNSPKELLGPPNDYISFTKQEGVDPELDESPTPTSRRPRNMGIDGGTSNGRPPMYSHASRSMIDFSSLAMQQTRFPSNPSNALKGKGKAESEEIPNGYLAIGKSSPTKSPALPLSPPTRPRASVTRRLSLPDLRPLNSQDPPPYPHPITLPRDDEGMEVLPPYSCRVHFEGSMPMKMEFGSPGILAKDRSWKKVWVILNGTCLWVYRLDPRRVAVKGPTGSPNAGGKKSDGVVEADDVVVGAPHVHLPEEVINYAILSSSRAQNPYKERHRGMGGINERPNMASPGRRSLDGRGIEGRSSPRPVDDSPAPSFASSRSSSHARSSLGSSSSALQLSGSISSNTSSSSHSLVTPRRSSDSEKHPVTPRHVATRPPHIYHSSHSSFLTTFKSNQVIKRYSLQQAETGLASDYHKKKNVIRVRAGGEQFLLQAENVTMTVDWIETFQAGANVAVDLDGRPMPKLPALPRRRRRRRPQAESEQTTVPEDSTSNTTSLNPNSTSNRSHVVHQRFPFTHSRHA